MRDPFRRQQSSGPVDPQEQAREINEGRQVDEQPDLRKWIR
ncbi:MAG TPA: hypothetical protein VGG02_08415 [Chthoniobacterales bacterium]|jgi:hypothetical protein